LLIWLSICSLKLPWLSSLINFIKTLALPLLSLSFERVPQLRNGVRDILDVLVDLLRILHVILAEVVVQTVESVLDLLQ
jgi:hypothetical protein